MTSAVFQRFLSFGLLSGVLASTAATAQTNPLPAPMPNAMAVKPGVKMLDGQKVYHYVEKMPVYLNGDWEGLQAAITSHVRGGAASGSRAFVTFVVDQQGTVRNPAFGGYSEAEAAHVDPALAEAFVAIGQFQPGSQNGKPVNVQLTMPIIKRPKK